MPMTPVRVLFSWAATAVAATSFSDGHTTCPTGSSGCGVPRPAVGVGLVQRDKVRSWAVPSSLVDDAEDSPKKKFEDACKWFTERKRKKYEKCGKVPPNVVVLAEKDFRDGTYVITQPGTYILSEDVEFEPDTKDHFPPVDSKVYKKEDGYWLGFFAAIAVAADNVVIDLNGHTLSMSYKFSLIQRFFSIIELGSKPFMASVGPPQFAASKTPLIAANSVTIQNGVLGLSSHMGIHGNLNQVVVIRDLVIRDFETGGIQLNGAEDVVISQVTVGPSLGAPGSSGEVPGLATLSQAHLLTRIVQGLKHESEDEFKTLSKVLDEFVKEKTKGGKGGKGGQLKPDAVFLADPAMGFAGLPDGSAIYGILLHRSGPAIQDFAACTSSQVQELMEDPLYGINITDVTIKDLHLKSDEVVKMVFKKSPVTGPAGDVVQVKRLLGKDGKSYMPTVLSEAQRRLAELQREGREEGMGPLDLFKNYGATNIPWKVLRWMKGQGTLESVGDKASYNCGGDAMSHFNKGVVGLRLEFVKGVALNNVHMSGLKNYGQRSPHHASCGTAPGEVYKGCDIRAVSIGGGTKVKKDGKGGVEGVTCDVPSFESTEGQIDELVDEGFDNMLED